MSQLREGRGPEAGRKDQEHRRDAAEGAPVSELLSPDDVRAVDRDPDPTAGCGDLALAFFREDAIAQGYTCQKPGCSRCGKHWEDYCRRIGILSPHREWEIRATEFTGYEEKSTWERE